MEYIYETPDNGKTVYRTPIGVPNAKRELVDSDKVCVDIMDDGSMIALVVGGKLCKWCHTSENVDEGYECTTCFEMRTCMIADLEAAEIMLNYLKRRV